MSFLAKRVVKRKTGQTAIERDAAAMQARAAAAITAVLHQPDQPASTVPALVTLEQLEEPGLDDGYELIHAPNSVRTFSANVAWDKAKTHMKACHFEKKTVTINELLTAIKEDELNLERAGALVKSLRRCKKLAFTANNEVRYRPTHNVRGMEELKTMLGSYYREGKGGVSKTQLMDAYPTVEADVETLKREKYVIAIKRMRRDKVLDEIIFYNDTESHLGLDSRPHTDFKKLWGDEGMKRRAKTDIEKELKKASQPVMKKAVRP